MRFREFKTEGAGGQSVYHVTFDKHIPKIKQDGLRPLQTSNWAKAGGDEGTRYNEEGGVFAFADPEDAFKWAFKQQFEFKEPVSILRLKRGNSWEKDPSGDIHLQMGKGEALRSIAAVPASDVEGAYSFTDFGNPGNGVSQQEWIQNSVNTISGQVTEARKVRGSSVTQEKIPKRVYIYPKSDRGRLIVKNHGNTHRVRHVSDVNPMTDKADGSGKWIFIPLRDVGGGQWINIANDEHFSVFGNEDDWMHSNDYVTEAPAKKAPAKKQTAAQKKAYHEKIRMSTQSGTIDKKQAWGVKKALTNIVAKYAVGDDWKMENQYLDAGLYYMGNDMEEAKRVGNEVIGALYGFFQDGSKKSITKLKREDDANTMQFTAMPMKDQFGQNPPQVSFVLHKNIEPGGPVIGIHLTV